MPWKESDKVSERMVFLSRYFAGERITDLSKEYGISRQTGHALVRRYKEEGAVGISDRSSRPHRSPKKTPGFKVDEILALRKKHPTWGPKKLKKRLEVLQPDVHWPAASTMGLILNKAGVVVERKRRRRVPQNPTGLRDTSAPNELWCMDYKGQFKLGNRKYCYPFTVTDHHSRFLLGCEALENTNSLDAEQTLWRIFVEYGLPNAIRSDNGSPFAARGRLGLSRLAVWLLRLGVEVERIQPGHPQQNGRHERMHRTLKAECTKPPEANFLAQQQRFDFFRKTYNEERPHEALAMKTPVTAYAKAERKIPEILPALEYPFHDAVCRVAKSGHFCLAGVGTIFFGSAFAGEYIGLRLVEDGTWSITFMETDLGYLDISTKSVIELPIL